MPYSDASWSLIAVSTLVVEWIEIYLESGCTACIAVSTLVVEWIEICSRNLIEPPPKVSTLVVEWIEIGAGRPQTKKTMCLHPRGGVD